MGLWNMFVLAIGAIASLLAVAFLAFLWIGSESARKGDPTPRLWFFIVDNDWATRVVTVASVLIRLATAAQMGVFAALIAAWILETTGASAEHLPMLSVIRTVNNGPQSHIWNVFHSLHVGSRYFYSAVIVLAILDALALQFTSTLLITDFQTVAIVPGAIQRPVHYAPYNLDDEQAGNVQAGNGVDFFQSGPAAYARFAEWAEQPRFDAEYADTGTTLRAFLPFGSSDDRSVLRSYDGPATIVDSRIRCVIPSIDVHNMTFLSQSSGGDRSNYEIAIAGKVGIQGRIPGQMDSEEQSVSDGLEGMFSISAVARIYYANATDWRLSYTLVPSFSEVSGFSNNVLAPDNTGFATLLLMNVTGDGWKEVLDNVTNFSTTQENLIVGPLGWNQTSSGLWTDLRPSNSTANIGISATLCFANFESNNYLVHADEGGDFTEPRNMTWVAGAHTYSTSTVRQMLDTWSKDLTPRQRGILRLHAPPNGNWSTLKIPNTDSDYITTPVTTGLRKLINPDAYTGYSAHLGTGWGASAAFTPFSSYNGVHKTHAALFQDIIQRTGNPALAFQAFFTIIEQMTYYDLLPQFDIAGNASYSLSQRVEVPAQWVGFGVVMGLLLLHAVLLVTAVVLFLVNSEHSLLGNAWQAVAQVSSSDMLETVHWASNMTDLEVKQLLRMSSSEENEVVLKTGADGGRSQAVYRRGTGDAP